jgi:MFS family permease
MALESVIHDAARPGQEEAPDEGRARRVMGGNNRRGSGPLANRDFRLLWLGEAVSSIGDQFALIALPWLALLLTGSGLALGSVLALMAVPRALLMLLGGVSVDRLSPRLVMLGSNAIRLVAVGILGLVVLEGAAQLWMLYAFALVFGIADAFFFPAQTSMVPELVAEGQLRAANGIVQGTAQAAVLVGPGLAGLVIATLAGTGGPGMGGVGVALLVDAVSFAISVLTLAFIRPRAHRAAAEQSVLEAIREGLRFVLDAPSLRAVILLSLTGNLLIVGPFEVGLPLIAYSRLPEGAAAFGVIMSAFGGGSLLGYAAGAALPAPRPSRFGAAVLLTSGAAGLGLSALVLISSTAEAAAVVGLAGLSLGYSNLLGMSWIQSRIPRQLMGRAMSLMMLGSMGLVPLSMLLAGIASQVSLDATLAVAGVGMAVACVGGLGVKAVRDIGLLPPARDDAAEPQASTLSGAEPTRAPA